MDKFPTTSNSEYIDLTILNTPKPQASSTVERKGVYSYRPDKTSTNSCELQNIKSKTSNNVIQADIPTRDTDIQSNTTQNTSVSSLGILSMDNFEDIKELLSSKDKINDSMKSDGKSSINDTLAIQRILAQKALDKVDFKVKENVAKIPSYLLKPIETGSNNTLHTPYKNESTINLSDLEKSDRFKKNAESNRVSFEEKEISARSSSFGNQKEGFSELMTSIDLRTPSMVRGLSSDFAAKYHNIYEQLRQSDASLSALCDRSSQMGMKTQPLGSLPLPDIETIDLDNSWTNSQQDSLISKLQNELFTPAELASDKLLADELSWRQAKDVLSTQCNFTPTKSFLELSCFSGYIGDSDISLKSETNERVSINEFFRRKTEDVEYLDLKSSPKKKHEPVPLIDVTNTTLNERKPSERVREQKENRMSTNSMISVSHIANVLSKMQIEETPSKALNLLLKKGVHTKIPTTPPSIISSDESTLKNTPVSKLYSPMSDTLANENSSTESCNVNNNLQDANKDIRIVDSEWIDAKANTICSSKNNATVSSIIESPSYSCSELEFSDDEGSSITSRLSDEFVHIDNMKSYKIHANISQNIPITLQSKTNHWLHVKISIKDINYSAGNNVQIDIINNQGVLNPRATEQFLVSIISSTCDNIRIYLQIEIEDIVTKSKKVCEHILMIEADVCKVKILNDILDFKLNPEGSIKRLMLPICNESTSSVTLSITIVQEYEWVFVFGLDTQCNYSDNQIETTRVIIVPAGSEVSVPVDMRGLALEDLSVSPGVDIANVVGCIQIQNINSNKLLHEVQLKGSVGHTKVQFKTTCMPFVILSGQTKPMQVRNSGVVPLELSITVILPDCDNNKATSVDASFILDRPSLVLQPGQVGTVSITFNPQEKLKSSKRIIRLDYPNGPSFMLPIEGVVESKPSDPVNILSPRRERPGSGSSYSSVGSLCSLADGKLPIQSTRTQLVWGCIRPGRSYIQDFVLRNCHTQRIRLQAVIHDSQAFKFTKDNNENTSMNLLLHARESRTISVSFSPNSKGAVAARLMFLPIIDHDVTNTKRQMIQLYGYGGHVAVDIQKVAKDISGHMWLSFGPLDYRDTLYQKFVLRNTGSITAFAFLSIACKDLYPFMDSSVTISPTEVIIEPNREVEISVNFTPRPEDFKYMQKSAALEVSKIASIKIMTGPEATRGRIRRLFNKINSNNKSGVMNELTSAFLLPRLSAVWPGEQIPSDVITCRESSCALRDLLRDIDTRDLLLTVEHTGSDCSTMAAALDDTLLFHSLAVADPENTLLNTTGRVSEGFCFVQPQRLVLTPNEQQSLIVRNHHARPMPYEICLPSTAAEIGLQASPLVGVISPGNVAAVTVLCTKPPTRFPYTCILMIYVENEVMDIELKITNIVG